MSAGRLLYLSAQDVADVGVSMSEIIEALEAMFVEKGKGEVEMPPKPGIHTRPNAFIHAMPAYIPSLGSAGLKWVSGYPDNPDKGLPYISGLLILNDPESGIPISVMDATWITAMRTGAATAVAAKRLARSDSRSVGIVACDFEGEAVVLGDPHPGGRDQRDVEAVPLGNTEDLALDGTGVCVLPPEKTQTGLCPRGTDHRSDGA